MLDKKLLKSEEKAIYELRSLYGKFGYLPYKMSKFEEYDLYVKNKDFLVSDSIITFNDTNGKLLALKPDVTLSIIKNGIDEKGVKQKVYYNENVYRVWGSTRQYKEIMQTGLECIGDLDNYDVFEVLYLAAKSLSTISSDYVLDISHLGILSAVLDSIDAGSELRAEIMTLIKQKNEHELDNVCEKYGVSSENCSLLKSFVSIYGSCDKTIEKLKSFKISQAYDKAVCELEELCSALSKTELKDKLRLDFSIVNDMNYYNGIVFNGFLNGVYECILFGGRYDKLLERMGRKSSAIGFALYLDLLEGMDNEAKGYDVDVLLVYSDETEMEKVNEAVQKQIEMGKSATAQKSIPEKLRYKELIDISREA